MELIKIIKALGDENRLRILNILYAGELCVCEIENILALNQSNVSRHLNKLNTLNIINSSKKAQYVYYSLNEDFLSSYPFVTEILSNETKKIPQFINDLEKLRYLKDNNISCEALEKCNLKMES